MSSLPATADALPQELHRLLSLAQAHFQQVFPVPRIDCALRGLQAGQAYVEDNLIRLNGGLLRAHGDSFLRETLPHELAHLIVWRLHGRRVRPHGAEWQAVMRLFGAEPERCHSFEVQPSRRQREYVYRCACKTHQLSAVRHGRIQRGGRYVCLHCQTPLRHRPPLKAVQLELPLRL
ncbi:MAG: SprT-like domain-containing protein [Nevskiales bacterium]